MGSIMVKMAIVLSMLTTPVGGTVYKGQVESSDFTIEKLEVNKFRMTVDTVEEYSERFPEYSLEESSMTTVSNAQLVLDTLSTNNF